MREQFGLLPYRAPTYSYGASANTLLAVSWDGMPERIECSLVVDAPRGWTVFTGYGGASRAGERVAMPADVGNTVISFGQPVALA